MIPLIAIILIIALLVLFAVRRGTTLTPREALINYLEAVRSGRTEDAYRYLSAADKAQQTLAEYKAANSLGNGLLAELMSRHISFVVEKIATEKDRVTAAVTMTAPDFQLMLGDIFQTLDPAVIPKQTLAALTFLCRNISSYLDRYQRDNLPMRTQREEFSLLREEDGWKIAGPLKRGLPAGFVSEKG